MITKDSTNEVIIDFVKKYVKEENDIAKIKEQNIKSNELFFFEDLKLIISKPNKLKDAIKKIKEKNKDIISFDLILNESSKEEDVTKFLKSEMKIEDEEIIDKFQNIDGKKFIKLNNDDNFSNIKFKLGEKKKLAYYINYIKTLITEEICQFLQETFKLTEDSIELIKENGITWEEFYKWNDDDYDDLNIEKKIKNEIQKYINEMKQENEKEEKIIEEDNAIYKIYQLIEIKEYITSQKDINKCPFNRREGFYELCQDMNIKNEENCSKINYDSANDIKLKIVSLWGSKEGILEFFNKKSMKETQKYFEEKNKIKSGIFLLINDTKSFGYIVIWPGKMEFLYSKMDQPQKGFLLSLIRMGLYLCNDTIICLTEKQQEEFDFQAFQKLNLTTGNEISEGKVKINKYKEENFKIEGKIIIEPLEEINENISCIKLNGNLLFFTLKTNESICSEINSNIPFYKLNFNDNNVIFDHEFDYDPFLLYQLLQKFNCFKNLVSKNIFLDLNDQYKIERINSIKEDYINILSLYIKTKNLSWKLNCEFCDEIKGNRDHQKLFTCSSHYQNSNRKINYILIDNESVVKELKNVQDFLNKKEYKIINEYINSLINNFEEDDFLEENFLNKLEEIKNKISIFIEQNKEKILIEDEKYLNYKDESEKKKKEIFKDIEFNFKNNYENINEWTEYKSVTFIENIPHFTFIKYKKIISKNIVKLFNIYKMDNESKFILKEKEPLKIWEEYYFENYFEDETGKNIFVKKENNLKKIKLKNNKNLSFNGCYDCDSKNGIFILSKDEGSIQKYRIYKFNKNKEKDLIFEIDEKIKKIKIIPYIYNNIKQYALFFTIDNIYLIDIDTGEIIYEFRNQNIYHDYNFEDFQFLIYEKFFIILHYNEADKVDKKWDCDIFNICPDEEVKFKKIENKTYFKAPKNCQFSVCSIKNEVLLYYIYKENNKYNFIAKNICSSLSIIQMKSSANDNKNENLKFNEGNCIFNYFYHCFIKFPAKSAIEYHYYDKNIVNNIYIFLNDINKSKHYEEYFDKLKEYIIKEKGLKEKDLNYEFKGIFKKNEIKNEIELGNLIIKFIEVVPIQIAKIKNYFFKAMSNGEDIDIRNIYSEQTKKLSKNKNGKNIKLSVDKYANYIDFGMKNSILNFYDLPVVVLVFMGSQSIGKSTLANTLIPSFFNVSGLRCTEGIWMSVSVYKGKSKELSNILCENCKKNKNENKKQVDFLCENCKKNNELKKCEFKCKNCNKYKCRLLEHGIDNECICDNCCCNEYCCLYIDVNKKKIKNNQINCQKRCHLIKGHEGYHICQVSCYKHGFICVSLDFEGLGTFERNMEQDLDLSMVGAALGNSIILRVDKTLDSFIKSIMLNWSEISKNIQGNSSINYFGGNLIFCQKDVEKSANDEVKHEFDKQIGISLNDWYTKKIERESRLNQSKLPIINDYDGQKNFEYFGIFSKYYHAPTPIFNKEEFHDFIRNTLINLVIKDVLIKKSLPNYMTGYKFMLSLRGTLASIDIHDYNLMGDFAIENLKSYLIENKDKAIAIFGVYSIDEELVINSFDEFEKILSTNLEKLKSSYISNIEQEIFQKLQFYIDMEHNFLKIKKVEFLNIKIDIESTDIQFRYKIIIEGLDEYGFLLFIPDEYKDKFTLENIRIKLFLLWKQICQNLEIKKNSIINNNFKNFIEAVISRRENNIKIWINNLTLSFTNKSIEQLKKVDSLNDKWKICQENCTRCFLNCTKLLGHEGEHDCGFNHFCQEKCAFCRKKIKCEDNEKCDNICKLKAGHIDGIHKCSHFHKCDKKCSRNKLRGCDKKCFLEYGHEGSHKCHSEKHLCDQPCPYKKDGLCNELCKLVFGHEGDHECIKKIHKCHCQCINFNKGRGCLNKGICQYNLPHCGEHDCGGKHLCPKKCNKIKLKGCKELCQLEFGHSKNIPHNCNFIHYCGKYCQFNQKNGICGKKCNLPDDHEGLHNCKDFHYCLKDCYYKDKSRSCNGKCLLEINHKGKCICDSNEHICNKYCSKKNCKNLCNLLSEHEENNHNCKIFHKCNKPCYLKEITLKGKCNLECNMEIDHDGNCLCSNKREAHLCRNNCINCNQSCSLEAGHKDSCFCGQCICDKECKYKGESWNCKEKCKLKFRHEGEHICEERNHLCIHDCDYKDKTAINGGCNNKCYLKVGHEEKNHCCNNPKEKHRCKNKCEYKDISTKNTCNTNCSLPIDHEPPCICDIPKDKHICNKKCKYSDFEGCKQFCVLPIMHNEECICSATKKGHLCGKDCTYIKARKGCNLKCNLPLEHPSEIKCKCSSDEKDHLCNGICQYNNSREGCLKICQYSLCDKHDCFCGNPIEKHICNKDCSLRDLSFEGSCKIYCTKQISHGGECMCFSKRHKCNKLCKYKESSRAGCNDNCSKDAGHEGEHICKNTLENHKCKEFCCLKKESRRKANHYCEKTPLHEGDHLCNLPKEQHKCNSKCSILDCNEKCNKIAAHTDPEHYCKNGHKCSLLCHLLPNTRLCGTNCDLEYGHEKLGILCICSKKENEHLCNQKCYLCKEYCNYPYNHKEEYHLCNNEHNCPELCSHKGYCEIHCDLNIQIRKIYHLKNNSEDIEYIQGGEQENRKKKCTQKIPAGLLKHEGEHKCQTDIHKCGAECLQCGRLCELDFGHNSKHYCNLHNQIVNCVIQTEDDNVIIKYRGKDINVKNEEDAIIYNCTQYCREQGRGHVHRLEKNKIDNFEENLNKGNIQKTNNENDDIYDCKCEFYWKAFLNFDFDLQFEDDLRKKFNLCPAKCPLCESDNESYCPEELWHKPLKSEDNKDINCWISLDGHKFKCKHMIPCYTIFIIDTSKSMSKNDIQPEISIIKNNKKFGKQYDNRLGSVIQVIDKYTKTRNSINPEDIFSFIKFNKEAEIFFEEINLQRDKINIINDCMEKIGDVVKGTCYLAGLLEAQRLLDKMDRKKYKPLIILLTDGHDEKDKEKETLKKIDEVSKDLFLIFYS